MTVYLDNFQIIRPNFERSQETILQWIVNAHMRARKTTHPSEISDQEHAAFSTQIKHDLFRIGLGKNKIQKRGFHINDCDHTNWDQMEIYNVENSPHGSSLDGRMAFFEKASDEIFEQFYPKEIPLPAHLIHVTCTGYVAPNPAQKLISARASGANTIVTNAYHMGCYAAIPAIRMAFGHYAAFSEATDIVHTEFCSLHMNPSMHSLEQLVAQSLFADGFIRYTVTGKKEKSSSPRLRILAIHEEIIEDSTTKMSWKCKNWGFEMTLSKEIPVYIRRTLDSYLTNMAKKAKRDIQELKKARFAIHPGGTKIIEQIAEFLMLEEKQYNHSAEVLRDYGNMSSGTIPHVWEKMIRDPSVKSGELIVGIAFGPGLSISGILFTKE